MNNTKYLRRAAIIAIVGNTILATLKITAGLLSNSKALLGDGIDSSSDVLISIVMLAVVGIIAKPADVEHPFGHRKVEAVATAFLSFVIFFAGAQLTIDAISDLINNVHKIAPSTTIVVIAIVSIVGKVLLALSQYLYGKKTNSSLLFANAKNMVGDVFLSASVLCGFVFSIITGAGYADSLSALFVGLWVIKTAFGIFTDVNLELMDGNDDNTPYRAIVEAVDAVEGASNPHRARVRNISGFWDIEFDIDVNPHYTVLQGHDIATEVEKAIKQRIDNVFDIMIHIEPDGDKGQEAFGWSETDMRDDDKLD